MTTTLDNVTAYYVGRSPRVKQKMRRLNFSEVDSSLSMQLAMESARRETIWIAPSGNALGRWMKNLRWPIHHNVGNLLLLSTASTGMLSTLHTVFHQVALPNPKTAVLQTDELEEALLAPNKSDLVIVAAYDKDTKTVTLWRGNFAPIIIPTTAFQVLAGGQELDFSSIAITDYGQTIRFGSYEASVDALLYEYDSVYRRRLARDRQSTEQGFGPSLRRLRLQKGLSRSSFRPLPEKTIARIERCEVKRIHSKTKSIIASRLQVDVSEIESY